MVKSLERRTAERGAAVLIVMLAVTMLTAVGVFAAHRSAMVTGASGYDRQANQTRYLAEYAGVVTASELGEGRGGAYIRLATDPNSGETCDAHIRSARADDLPQWLPCYGIEPDDLAAQVGRQSSDTSLLDEATADDSGSLSGPGAAPLDGVMRVELLDARPLLSMPGMDASGASPFRPFEVTYSAWAQIRAGTPGAAANTWADNPGLAGHASVQALRAQLRVPDVSL